MIPGFPGVGPRPPKRGKKPPKPIKRTKLKAWRPEPEDLAWAKAVRAKGPCIAKSERLFVVVGVDNLAASVTLEQIHPPCGALTAAHIVSRRYLATRKDLDNGVPLCFTAHDHFTRHPDQWVDFIREYLGEEKYEALRAKAHAGPKSE